LVARTYAPGGPTPVLRAPLTPDPLAVLSAVTPQGRLFTRIQDRSLRGPDVVAFLRQLLRQVPGKRLVVWDGAPIHHCRPVKDFLAAGAAKRMHLERLPGYAPDLNPAAGVWNLLKRVERTNRCCHDQDELRWEVRPAVRPLQGRPHLLIACFHHCGYVQ
jgi:transposase